MIVFLLAGVIDANGGAPPGRTLAGLTLRSTLARVSIEHPGAQLRRNGAGSRWTWKRPTGGTVIVLLDNAEKVVDVSFMADQGESDGVDLPCVKNFPVQDSQVNLDTAIDRNECVPIGNDKYRLRDGSILEVAFGGPGDGQLRIARWHNPGARKAAWPPTQVAVTVFDCLQDAAAPPKLRIYDMGQAMDRDFEIHSGLLFGFYKREKNYRHYAVAVWRYPKAARPFEHFYGVNNGRYANWPQLTLSVPASR